MLMDGAEANLEA